MLRSATHDPSLVSVVFANGTRSRFHALWLRDNALDPNTCAPSHGQRLITVGDIPADITVSAVKVVDGNLQVSFQPEGKTTTFPADWLAVHGYDHGRTAEFGRTTTGITTWQNGIAAPSGDWEQVHSDPSPSATGSRLSPNTASPS